MSRCPCVTASANSLAVLFGTRLVRRAQGTHNSTMRTGNSLSEWHRRNCPIHGPLRHSDGADHRAYGTGGRPGLSQRGPRTSKGGALAPQRDRHRRPHPPAPSPQPRARRGPPLPPCPTATAAPSASGPGPPSAAVSATLPRTSSPPPTAALVRPPAPDATPPACRTPPHGPPVRLSDLVPGLPRPLSHTPFPVCAGSHAPSGHRPHSGRAAATASATWHRATAYRYRGGRGDGSLCSFA